MKILLALVMVFIVGSCSSIKECTDKKEGGNLGKLFNTESDEYAPVFYGDKLYFTSLNINNSDNIRIFYSDYLNGKFGDVIFDNAIPVSFYPNSGLPVFFERNSKQYVIFAGMNTNSKRKNSDLFISEYKSNIWSAPVPLPGSINSDFYESYPSVTKDGSMLFFVSDRPNGIGGLDIYTSIFEEGEWAEPINLGSNINSGNDELSPFISDNYDFYYSSDRNGGIGGFDIYKANFLDQKWGESILLKQPLNSDKDEIGAAIVDNQIIISSNRSGGCGGKDLYSFLLCNPVIYHGIVKSPSSDMPVEGTAYLLDENRNVILEKMVDNLGTFEFELIPQKKYIIRYFNACVPNYVPEQTIIVPCNDSSAVKFTSNVLLPDNIRMFDFANYKVPFFVTGYYFPNTIDNLNALRLKFTYNIVGKNDNTKYIENPGDIYDGYSLKVESALNEVVSYIVSIFDNLNSDCSERKSKLKIRITGFSDPRPISTKSIYDDDTINDQLLGISIDRGNLIDNTILSKLRAYYTLKFIQGKLANHNAYLKNKDNIVWEIEGLGVADDMLETELQRRVNIEIGLVKE